MATRLEEERAIVRYLLGRMSGREREEFEDRYFADDDLYHSILAVEDDLIDSYAQGRLNGPDRQDFEQRYLSTSQHAQRVEFARALRRGPPEPELKPAEAPRWWRGRRWLLSPMAWAPAAVLLVAIAASWWLAQRAARAPVPEPERKTAEQRRPAPGTPPQSKPAAEVATIAFVLNPGALRSPGEHPRLVIPREAAQVRLQVELEVSGFPGYLGILRTVEGAEIWRKSELRAQDAILSLTLPAALFKTADYILTVSGVKHDGALEVAGEYPLSVSKP